MSRCPLGQRLRARPSATDIPASRCPWPRPRTGQTPPPVVGDRGGVIAATAIAVIALLLISGAALPGLINAKAPSKRRGPRCSGRAPSAGRAGGPRPRGGTPHLAANTRLRWNSYRSRSCGPLSRRGSSGNPQHTWTSRIFQVDLVLMGVTPGRAAELLAQGALGDEAAWASSAAGTLRWGGRAVSHGGLHRAGVPVGAGALLVKLAQDQLAQGRAGPPAPGRRRGRPAPPARTGRAPGRRRGRGDHRGMTAPPRRGRRRPRVALMCRYRVRVPGRQGMDPP